LHNSFLLIQVIPICSPILRKFQLLFSSKLVAKAEIVRERERERETKRAITLHFSYPGRRDGGI